LFTAPPWADSLRPTLTQLETLCGPARRLWDNDLSHWREHLGAHLIFWGPPGSGKTTLALLLAESQQSVPFRSLSAVRDGINEIKKALNSLQGGGILFIDEIHRLTRPQQDLLLPTLESGDCWLIAATTESPSGTLCPAILSRVRTLHVRPPDPNDLQSLFVTAFSKHPRRGELVSDPNKTERILSHWIPVVATRCAGDVRMGLNLLDGLIHSSDVQTEKDLIQGQLRAWTTKTHFDYVSAMIKSMRGSDPDAALFYGHAAIQSGEDPLYLLRRCIIFASEDVGNADPAALRIVLDCHESFEKIGLPEGMYAVAQAICYLSATVKSNRILKALETVDDWWTRESGDKKSIAPPEHLILKGHQKYKYPHDFPEGFVREQYLPQKIETLRSKLGAAYRPTEFGAELKLKERLRTLWSK
jgi:putative ATPase